VPFFKAIGVKTRDDLARAADFHAKAILLDAHAPGVYGGTGETFDWNAALDFKTGHPEIPIILAGGITPENAALAAGTVRPAAIDVASGAEVSPGIKDFDKVSALLAALKR
jgi:phosphoribosylanthranilate isomerase